MKRSALLLVLLVLLVLLGCASCGGEAPGTPAASRQGPAASSRATPEMGAELRRGSAPRELARIGLRGVWIGTEGGPLEWKPFVEPSRADDAWYFLGLYAPFEMKSSEGDLAFRGHGKARPSSVEQRMILEWARRVATEAAGGRGSAAYGLVFALHQGGPADICEDVVLDLTGEAAATACGWDRGVRGRLDAAPLGRVYEWFDRLQPFQTGSGGQDAGLHSGELQARLIFAGRGPRFASAAEQEQIQTFAAALFAELSARRRGIAPPGLLLPPGAGAKAAEIVLQLPEKPPPPPRPPTRTLTPGPSPAPSLPPSPGEGNEEGNSF
jgi:hypothetical protein